MTPFEESGPSDVAENKRACPWSSARGREGSSGESASRAETRRCRGRGGRSGNAAAAAALLPLPPLNAAGRCRRRCRCRRGCRGCRRPRLLNSLRPPRARINPPRTSCLLLPSITAHPVISSAAAPPFPRPSSSSLFHSLPSRLGGPSPTPPFPPIYFGKRSTAEGGRHLHPEGQALGHLPRVRLCALRPQGEPKLSPCLYLSRSPVPVFCELYPLFFFLILSRRTRPRRPSRSSTAG